MEKCRHEERISCYKCFSDSFDLTDCPKNCGENTVCKHCAEYEGKKCQRCTQTLEEKDAPPITEQKSIQDGLRNWATNFEGFADPKEERDWDFRCLECGQKHIEVPGTYGGFLVPVNCDGDPVECTRLPKIENGVCQDCGNKSEHTENCRFWKAKKELREEVTSGDK